MSVARLKLRTYSRIFLTILSTLYIYIYINGIEDKTASCHSFALSLWTCKEWQLAVLSSIPFIHCKASAWYPLEVNQILYNFVWKGKDKVKRAALINDIKDGGLKMPHIESMIETQRIVCIQKFQENSPCSWKYVLGNYLRKIGGKLLFDCNFDYSKLSVDLPKLYRECLIAWCRVNRSNPVSANEIADQILWNNRFICIDNKSVFNQKLFSAGFCKVRDLINFMSTDHCEVIIQLKALDF